MTTTYAIVIIVIAAILLILFLIMRNNKDRRDLEQTLHEDAERHVKHFGEEGID